MSTLKAKLDETIASAEEAESELAAMNGKSEALEAEAEEKTAELNAIEDELDAAESKLQNFTESLGSAEKGAEEGLQARKQLENRGRNDNKRATELEVELAEVQGTNNELQEQFEEISVQLAESEENLDLQEERVESADTRVKALEGEVTQVGNSLRSMELNEGQAVVRSESGNSKIGEMETKYKDKEASATHFEELAKQLEEESDARDEALNSAKDKHDATKQELDALIAEISEM